MNSYRILLGLGLLACTAVLTPPLQGQDDTFEWSQRMTSGQILEVKGIVGDVRATLASGDQAQVVATKRGEEDDFHQVAVEVAEDGDRIIICAVYGEWNHGEGHCHPDHRDTGDDEEHRNVNIDVEVDYEVRLPAGVEFDAVIVSGDIEAEGLRSDLTAKTVDGHITVSTTGRAWANTVSGNMDIEMGDLGRGDLDFNTVSGDITLWLPANISADVEFSSLSGDFETDFDLDITRQKDQLVGSRVEGTIGGGGREITLNTVSGDVELRRARR